jgi:hypothetical protein
MTSFVPACSVVLGPVGPGVSLSAATRKASEARADLSTAVYVGPLAAGLEQMDMTSEGVDMTEPEVSTYHQDGRWYNRIEGDSRNVSGPFHTKEEAEEAAHYYASRHGGHHRAEREHKERDELGLD